MLLRGDVTGSTAAPPSSLLPPRRRHHHHRHQQQQQLLLLPPPPSPLLWFLAAAAVSMVLQPWSITFQISHVKLHGIATMPRDLRASRAKTASMPTCCKGGSCPAGRAEPEAPSDIDRGQPKVSGQIDERLGHWGSSSLLQDTGDANWETTHATRFWICFWLRSTAESSFQFGTSIRSRA